MNPFQSFVKGISDYFNPPTKPQPDVIGTPADIKITYGSATPTPMQQFAASTQPGFRYKMGANDYSDVAPQVTNVVKGTPLEPYANDFVQAGQKYGVDPRVLPTIANNESSLGKSYPPESHNPFGYLVLPEGQTPGNYDRIKQGLIGAGFTSEQMAIDRLTHRLATNQFPNYQKFRENPTIENLQAAYNATPTEAATWIKNGKEFVSRFKN